jgi:hypothetical protein
MKDVLVGIIGFYIVILLMAILIIGGIPTDTSNMIFIFATIYIPLFLPLAISIFGLKAVDSIDKIEIKKFSKIGMGYFLLEIIFYFIYFHLRFNLAFCMFFKSLATMLISLIALIIIIKACELRD